MATTDAAAANHKVVLRYLFEEVYGDGSYCETIGRLVDDGLLQIDRLYEMFEAKQWGTNISSTYGYDLENGLECKLRTTYVNSAGSVVTYLDSAATANKIGDIVLGITNRETWTFDRFLLPRGVGYQPGRTKTITWNRSSGTWGINEQWKISTQKIDKE